MTYYDLTTMLAVLGAIPRFDPLLLRLFFPEMVLFDTPEIAFDKLQLDESEKLAPFVSPFAAGKAGKLESYKTASMKPAYVKPLNIVDPEQLFMRQPGEMIGGSLSPQERRDAIIAKLLDQHRSQIMHRLEWMAAGAMRAGKYVVEGEDYPKQTVDFDRTSTLSKTLTTTGRWSETTSSPPDDLEAWDAELDAPSTDVVMNGVAWKYFSKHAETKARLLNTERNGTATLDLGPNGNFVQLKGVYGNKRIWTYAGYYRDGTGTKQLYIPTGEIVIGSPAIAGVRAHGAILDKAAGYQALEMFPKNWGEENPSLEYVMTQSAPLIVPRRKNASMCVKVTDATS